MSRRPAQPPTRRQDSVAASSIWIRLGLVAVIAGPWVPALVPALFGHQRDSYGALGAVVGAVMGSLYRDRVFLRLPRESRRTVVDVQRSGELTGDAALDGIAIDRLERVARVARLDRALLPVVLAFYVAIPVVAAVRDDPWWLACLLPGAIAVLAIRPVWPPQDPRIQLSRLLQPAGAS